jgi:hypothetical protein
LTGPKNVCDTLIDKAKTSMTTEIFIKKIHPSTNEDNKRFIYLIEKIQDSQLFLEIQKGGAVPKSLYSKIISEATKSKAVYSFYKFFLSISFSILLCSSSDRKIWPSGRNLASKKTR